MRRGARAAAAAGAAPAEAGAGRGTVFVAGAAGRTGRRVVRELLAGGWSVRAGVRLGGAAVPPEVVAGAAPGQLTEVGFDLSRPASLPAALGDAEAVVCCVGAPEEVLKWKRVGEEAVVASGVPYTILRPGGMEKPGDDYGNAHNLVFAEEDTRFGGQVSRLQVAQVAAEALRLGPGGAAANKVVEVVAETTAPRKALEDLFEAIEAEAAPLPGTPEAFTAKY